MSAYKNFIFDFPSRCRKLLDLIPKAEENDLEVTLLLAVASQAIITPYERLQADHPSCNQKSFRSAAQLLEELCNEKCNASKLFYDTDGQFCDQWGWTVCSAQELAYERVRELDPIRDKRCREVVHILRNALAHGSIWTDGNPINRLIFASRIEKNGSKAFYNRLECDPESFRRFVLAWVEAFESVY